MRSTSKCGKLMCGAALLGKWVKSARNFNPVKKCLLALAKLAKETYAQSLMDVRLFCAHLANLASRFQFSPGTGYESYNLGILAKPNANLSRAFSYGSSVQEC